MSSTGRSSMSARSASWRYSSMNLAASSPCGPPSRRRACTATRATLAGTCSSTLPRMWHPFLRGHYQRAAGEPGPSLRSVFAAHHEHRSISGGLPRAAVFGVSDGLVSNVSLVIGFAGSGVGADVVRLAGLAGLIAGAISMAAGEYVSVSAQNELIERELEIERREIARHPEAETAELVRAYESKGVQRQRAKDVAADIMRSPDTALSEHARQELGIDPDSLASPWRTAVSSFLAFCVGAVLPVIPWFFGSGAAAAVLSISIGIVAAAIVGALIGRFAERSVVFTAVRQVFILVLACGATYAIGRALGVTIS